VGNRGCISRVSEGRQGIITTWLLTVAVDCLRARPGVSFGVIQRQHMYGLKPTEIDHLDPLRGAEITQICIGPHDLQFNFQPQGNLSVWGRCELLDPAGTPVILWGV
jgi:hypothetical protein